MSSSILVLLTVFSLCMIHAYSDGCNYAQFSASVVDEFDIGTFSLSTNRCQSLKSLLNYEILGYEYNYMFDGSLLLECLSSTELSVSLYDSATCNNQFVDPIYINMSNNEFDIFGDTISFNLDELSCDNTDCFISMKMSSNCSWINSLSYFDISIPPQQCISLAPDFQGVLSSIPYEFLPDDLVDTLDSLSVNFTCCSQDNSLLILNYTDTRCNHLDSKIRIQNKYNGQCFVIGPNQDIFNGDSVSDTQDAHSDDANNDDTYVFIMEWQCNTFVECNDIPFLDDKYLPKQCLDTCTNANNDTDTNDNGGNASNNNNSLLIIVVIIVGVIIVFVLIVGALFIYSKRRKMQKQLEIESALTINSNINHQSKNKGDSKYEQMITEDEQEDYMANDDSIDEQDQINRIPVTTATAPTEKL